MRRSPFAPRLVFVMVGILSAAAVVTTHAQVCLLQERQKLTASDSSEDDRFGNSVSISGNWAIVGAYLDNVGGSGSGSAHVCRRDDSGTPSDPGDDFWVERAKLTASDAAAGNLFGLFGVRRRQPGYRRDLGRQRRGIAGFRVRVSVPARRQRIAVRPE